MIYSALSYLIPALLLILVGVMMYWKLYREFPFFFAYILLVVLGEFIRFFVRRSWPALPQYFYTYWITEAVEVGLGFLVLYEVFLLAAFPRFNITAVYRRLFPITGLVVLGLAVWMFFGASTKGPNKIVALVGRFALALNFCQVAVMMFFGLLILYMSRDWRRHEMGIATGFGVHAAVKLLATAQWVGNAYVPTKIFQLPNISYLVAVLIWLFYLSRSDPEPERVEMTGELLSEVDRVYGEVLPVLRKRKRWD